MQQSSENTTTEEKKPKKNEIKTTEEIDESNESGGSSGDDSDLSELGKMGQLTTAPTESKSIEPNFPYIREPMRNPPIEVPRIPRTRQGTIGVAKLTKVASRGIERDIPAARKSYFKVKSRR
jgi:hypothetical protein